MNANSVRPLAAYVLVSLACTVVVAQGLQADALDPVVRAAPAASAQPTVPGTVLRAKVPRVRSITTRPVLARQEQAEPEHQPQRAGQTRSSEDEPGRPRAPRTPRPPRTPTQPVDDGEPSLPDGGQTDLRPEGLTGQVQYTRS